MFEALMVLCKVTMAASGSKEAAQGSSGKEELWWPFLYVYAKVFIAFRCHGA